MTHSAIAAGNTANSQLENSSYYQWVEPNSDITVSLSPQAVDRLQLDVLRSAIHPRAPREVGGILLGRTESGPHGVRIVVENFEPVPCQYRHGPGYALSVEEMPAFAAALARTHGTQPHRAVGYYRGHNRDGLYLSAQDLSLIGRHFADPDNVFLLIKTLPNRACTAGFFFWKDGRIQSEFTDSEAPLIPVALPAEEPVPPQSRTDESPPPERRNRRRLILCVALAGIAACSVAVVRYQAPRALPAPDRSATAVAPSELASSIPAEKAPAKQTPRAEAVRQNPDPPQPFVRPGRRIAATRKFEQRAASRAAATAQPTVIPPPPKLLDGISETARAQAPPGAIIAPPAPVIPPPVPEKTVAPAAPATPAERPVPTAPAPITTRTAASTGPKIVHQVTPAVPRGVAARLTTDVVLEVEVTIDAAGKVTSARMASARGSAASLLTIEALKAAQLFRFRPAQEDGRNVTSSMILTFQFQRNPN